MTLWKNESEDTVTINFDVGNGPRELITLAPGAEIELPSRLDKYVPMEAPQLQVVKLKPTELPVPKKSGRKPKDAQ